MLLHTQTTLPGSAKIRAGRYQTPPAPSRWSWTGASNARPPPDPSCEGGVATGTHLHIARKYNGEWILADGALPFVLSGWRVYAGDRPYQGKLVKGDKVITADLYAQSLAVILRDNNDE